VVSGKTEYVWMIFFGKRSFSLSRRKDPKPDPVPPAIECSIMKPYRISHISPFYSCTAYLKGVTAVCFAINHLHDFLVNCLSCLISITPVICCTYSVLSNEKVFRVVNILIRAGLDAIEDLLTYQLQYNFQFVLKYTLEVPNRSK
jgi:hypothetical protein